MRRDLLGRTGLSLAIRLGGIALNFLALLVLARSIDAGELGRWAWAAELIALLAAMAGLGFNMIAIRVVPDCLIARDAAQLARFVRRGLLAALAGSALAGLGLLGALQAGWLMPGIDRHALALMVLVLAAFAALRFVQEVMRGAGRLVWAQLGEQVLWPLALLGAACWLAASGGQAMPVLLAGQLALLAGLSITLAAASLRIARDILLPADHTPAAPVDWLAGGLPLALCAALSLLLKRGDLIALGMLADAQAVAFYTPASRYAALLVLGQAAASMAAAGRMRALWRSGDLRGLQRLLDEMAAISVLFALPLCALFWLLPETMLGVFGADYAAAAEVLRLLVTAQLVNCWTGPIAALVVAAGLERVFTVATASACALLLGGLALLVPRWGMTGAAAASLIGIAGLNLAMVAVIWRRTGLVCWARPGPLAALALSPFGACRRARAQ